MNGPYEKAKEAITAVFHSRQSIEATISDLEGLRDEIDLYIDALNSDLARQQELLEEDEDGE